MTKIILAIILLIIVFVFWLKGHIVKYYAQKLKDMNEGNLE